MRLPVTAIAILLLWLAAPVAAARPAAQTENLASKSQEARDALLGKRFEEAIQLYGELVEALPGEAGLLLNLGLAQHSAGRFEQAISTLRASLEIQPDSFPALFVLGVCLLKTDRTAEAIPLLERAVQLQPNQTLARFELADALLSTGRFQDAAYHFRILSKAEPANARVWFGLGIACTAQSRAAFERLESKAPESGYWYALLARSRAEQQQYRSAYHFYRKAQEELPDLRGIHAAVAEIYRATNSPEWAAKEAERERQLPPLDCDEPSLACSFRDGHFSEVIETARMRNDPESLYWMARAYSELAFVALRRVEALPESAVVHELQAEVFRVQERHQEAAAEWKKALQLAPGDSRIKKELARSLGLSREFEVAIPILEELLAESPEAADIWLMLGDSYLELQRPEKAIPALEAALRHSPDLIAAQSTLGRAYLQVEETGKAIPHLEAALAEDEDGTLHYLLGQAYLRTSGDRDAARNMIEKSRQLRLQQRNESEARDQAHQITPP